MTLSELLQYLDQHSPYEVLDGDPAATLDKSRAGRHRNPVVGEIIQAIAEGNGCQSVSCTLQRAEVVKSVGPLRLKYMADDAPVEGFRTVEGLIHTVDAAYDEEALRQKHGG